MDAQPAKVSSTETHRPLWQAIKDLGWFSVLFATIVGAPSLLSLFQAIFIHHRLVDALQWVVDGYNNLAGVLGFVVEPLALPLVRWLEGVLNLHLDLRPHWRNVFVVGMIPLLAIVRSHWRQKKSAASYSSLAIGAVGVTLASLVVGLAPVDSDWLAQGWVTAAPMLILGVIFAMYKLWEDGPRAFFIEVLRIPLLTIMAYAAPIVLIIFVPGLERGAGLVWLLVAVLIMGGMFVLGGIESSGMESGPLRARSNLQIGLTIVGGFIAAAAVIAIDLALKMFA